MKPLLAILLLLAAGALAQAPEVAPSAGLPLPDATAPFDPSQVGTRLKDIARVTSVRGNQLFGYGLVIGLAGTGDGQQTAFTTQTLVNALRELGINPESANIRVKNIAAVMVTAELPAFSRPGDRIDVTVSSVGDAKSLQGGTLLLTPLQGADGEVYAVGQGPVSIGGYASQGGGGGASATKSHPTAGLVPNGAYVERETPTQLTDGNSILVTLFQPDFTTASRVARAVNRELTDVRAAAVDAGTIKVSAADIGTYTAVDVIAELENVRITPDNRARIVINERTGTVVLGGDVRVMPGAVAHGALQVEVRPVTTVVQPPPLSNGQTVVLPGEDLTVGEPGGSLASVGGGATIQDVIASLNALGAKPTDMIAILEAMQAAGLLLADLEIQ